MIPFSILHFTPIRLLKRRVALLATVILGLSMVAPADAAEIRVLTSGAFRSIVASMATSFEAATGNKVVIENDTAGALMKKVEGGAPFDVLVLTPDGLAALAGKGLVTGDSIIPLAKVGIGIAVKDGASVPDISTVAAFKQTLLSASKIAMIDPASGGSSGIYLMQVFEQLGIADQLKPKLILVPGGLVATRLLSGEATIAIHQISEIMAVKGVSLVGPLPADVQNYTVYAGSVSTETKVPDEANAFLKTLASPQAAPVLKASGMLPPG